MTSKVKKGQERREEKMGKRGKKEGHHCGTQTPQTKVCAFRYKKREDREREDKGGESLESKTKQKNSIPAGTKNATLQDPSKHRNITHPQNQTNPFQQYQEVRSLSQNAHSLTAGVKELQSSSLFADQRLAI